mmetsp:Transcript_46999/g.134459  ORF Transcript_46999/g.134459 Transcript_46999/m.134459 type:complete len:134 (-) Transcript_46999:360-761(-)
MWHQAPLARSRHDRRQLDRQHGSVADQLHLPGYRIIWSASQLGSINRDALKKHAMDIREHVGAVCLPPMLQHLEDPARRSPGSSSAGDPRRDELGAYVPSADGVTMTEGQQAYSDASSAARAASDRNRGSGIF